MLNLVTCFLIATLASFLGSLQPGPVNLQVIRVSHLRGSRAALIVALGGSVPELIYVSAAFLLSYTWIESEIWKSYSHLGLMAIMLAVASYLFFKTEKKDSTESKSSATNLFFSGFFLALVNPLLLPFWIFIITYTQSLSFVDLSSTTDQLAFSIGSAVGAFLILAIFARITAVYSNVLSKIPLGINKIVALIFASLALLELFKFLYSR